MLKPWSLLILGAFCMTLLACGGSTPAAPAARPAATTAPTAVPPTALPEPTPEPTSAPTAVSSPTPDTAADEGQLTLQFDSFTEAYPPSATIYMINTDGSGYIVAEMPEQPAGTPFTMRAPPRLYYVYARSTRLEDPSFFALWDAEVLELPALAVIDIEAGRMSGPFDLARSPDFCGERYILPESPDGIFPATNTPEYRRLLGCE